MDTKDTIESASRTGRTHSEKCSDTGLQEIWLDASCNGMLNVHKNYFI